MKSTYRLAGHTIKIESLYSRVNTLCAAYRVEDDAEYCITTTPADIAYERKRSVRADELEGAAVREYAPPYLETLAVYRKLAQQQLLTPEEYAAPDNLPELRDGWFRVPQKMDDMKYADQVRFIRRTMWKEPEHITSYTIFTTTDCNARCFYCYELGRSRIPMSDETAHKAAAYIAAHCGGEKVHLHWFGGEPLFNKQVIDIICTDLAEKGIVYESMIISNGYLFDGATVEQAVSHWKLKSVQITLDGTEEIYNRSKAFIYTDGKSPYQVVLANIQRLLDAGVSVHIRLNRNIGARPLVLNCKRKMNKI